MAGTCKRMACEDVNERLSYLAEDTYPLATPNFNIVSESTIDDRTFSFQPADDVEPRPKRRCVAPAWLRDTDIRRRSKAPDIAAAASHIGQPPSPTTLPPATSPSTISPPAAKLDLPIAACNMLDCLADDDDDENNESLDAFMAIINLPHVNFLLPSSTPTSPSPASTPPSPASSLSPLAPTPSPPASSSSPPAKGARAVTRVRLMSQGREERYTSILGALLKDNNIASCALKKILPHIQRSGKADRMEADFAVKRNAAKNLPKGAGRLKRQKTASVVCRLGKKLRSDDIEALLAAACIALQKTEE